MQRAVNTAPRLATARGLWITRLLYMVVSWLVSTWKQYRAPCDQHRVCRLAGQFELTWFFLENFDGLSKFHSTTLDILPIFNLRLKSWIIWYKVLCADCLIRYTHCCFVQRNYQAYERWLSSIVIFQFLLFIPEIKKHVVSDQTYNCPSQHKESMSAPGREEHLSIACFRTFGPIYQSLLVMSN